MSATKVEVFIRRIEIALKQNFSVFEIEKIFQTPKSFKANIHLSESIFIAVRYNARNERIDFALIKDNRRVFGYDNLKRWHQHPIKNPEDHVNCVKPSIEKIIRDVKEAYDLIALR
jgi:hypothetical protein